MGEGYTIFSTMHFTWILNYPELNSEISPALYPRHKSLQWQRSGCRGVVSATHGSFTHCRASFRDTWDFSENILTNNKTTKHLGQISSFQKIKIMKNRNLWMLFVLINHKSWSLGTKTKSPNVSHYCISDRGRELKWTPTQNQGESSYW